MGRKNKIYLQYPQVKSQPIPMATLVLEQILIVDSKYGQLGSRSMHCFTGYGVSISGPEVFCVELRNTPLELVITDEGVTLPDANLETLALFIPPVYVTFNASVTPPEAMLEEAPVISTLDVVVAERCDTLPETPEFPPPEFVVACVTLQKLQDFLQILF